MNKLCWLDIYFSFRYFHINKDLLIDYLIDCNHFDVTIKLPTSQEDFHIYA